MAGGREQRWEWDEEGRKQRGLAAGARPWPLQLQAPTALRDLGGAFSHRGKGGQDLADSLNMQF